LTNSREDLDTLQSSVFDVTPLKKAIVSHSNIWLLQRN